MSKKEPALEREPALDVPGWGLLCDFMTTDDPEIERRCPGWLGGSLPETTYELKQYVHAALDKFQDITLWGGVKEIWKGGCRIDTRRRNKDFQLRYANAILRNANRWLNRNDIFDPARPNRNEAESLRDAEERLNDLLIWLGGLCASRNEKAPATNTAPARTPQPAPTPAPDGPSPPNWFWWRGEQYELPRQHWQILNHLWSRPVVMVEDLARAIWGDEGTDRPDTTIRARLSELNARLAEIGVDFEYQLRQGQIRRS